MLYSMTGYGRAEQTINDKVFLVEVRSLNGKQYDIRLNMPGLLKSFEMDIRGMLNEGLVRGSIECNISLKQNGSSKPVSINTALLKAYYAPVMETAKELGIGTENILSALLKLPEVVSPTNEMLSDDDWNGFQKVLQQAIDQLNEHRRDEGKSMEDDLLARIQNIEFQQAIIAPLEPARREKIKDGLKKVLEENVGKENYDPNRLEQELIYYIEKIDISEEQVRLKNHCDYFRTILNEKEISKGKKLSFILQEIGREINTTGSKAYDSTIQKCVVLMKDELEKAKEQILNIL
ncbi:YicC family protein [Panacibacter ginsenosidivorans]|uniref:YicC family protein n=1 Tax=Panacibacter ginsenosidivorans TaxID=1813871 RepID=A0A5B8VBC8_9BACT|nr:YicC/YloC family endoribonuclease [Panacibacter ginsenosidivorans]QEC68221.1 YicC family protein [Panacibacter ginsenosidivorans]